MSPGAKRPPCAIFSSSAKAGTRKTFAASELTQSGRQMRQRGAAVSTERGASGPVAMLQLSSGKAASFAGLAI